MGLNCKPGDLAVVMVGGVTKGLPGTIVDVLRSPEPQEEFRGEGGGFIWLGKATAWVCRAASGRSMPWFNPDTGKTYLFAERVIADSILRPIRDTDGEDETFTWAGKPQKEKA